MTASPWSIGRRYVMHIDGMELWATLVAVTDHELVLGQVVFWSQPSNRLPVAVPGSRDPEPDALGRIVSVPEMIVSRRTSVVAALWEPRPVTEDRDGPYR